MGLRSPKTFLENLLHDKDEKCGRLRFILRSYDYVTDQIIQQSPN